MTNNQYQHVDYLWDDAHAATLDPVERLVYRSNLLGEDQRITNTGGGNTSSKLVEHDPLTGEPLEVLWVKGSGGDLRTANRENFGSLYQEKVMALREIYNRAEVKGAKTEIEDSIVAMYNHAVYNLNPRACSIDTPLHAFVPQKHVDHTHPNAAISVAAARDSQTLTTKIYGDDVAWTPWQRPGFDLGLVIEQHCLQYPNLKGIILGQHGLINWDDDDKACYELSLDLIERAAQYIQDHDKGDATFGGQQYQPLDDDARDMLLAEVLPHLRGMISQQHRFIATVQTDETILRFVNSIDAPRLAGLGTSCPDHFLRTKIKPLYVAWNPQTEDVAILFEKLEHGLLQYRQDYIAYYERCKRPDSPAMRDPNPTVILIPGVGMIAWGKNKSESRVTAEFYNCAVEVMRGAEAIDEYIALPAQEAFDIEYWALEEAKLRRMPPEKTLARKVVIIVGAGSGIGKTVAHRVAKEGAHVVCADLNAEAALATAQELTDIYGMGIGIAGSGLSNCGPAIGLQTDITDRASLRKLFTQTVLAYGGIDNVIVTAGIYLTEDAQGCMSEHDWKSTYDINVMGSYLVADEARSIWEAQGISGSLVLTSSANAVVSKRGSVAYDTSKAAVNHLVRELAVILAPHIRVNGLAPATVLDGSNMFPRERLINSLTKYSIDFDEQEETVTLRDKLAHFYAQRTLIQQPITTADQAEIIYLLNTDSFSKTTGQILAVDGGLEGAFLR